MSCSPDSVANPSSKLLERGCGYGEYPNFMQNDALASALRSIIYEATRAAFLEAPQVETMSSRPGNSRMVLLTENEVSDWLNLPISTLRDWRQKRIHIPWIPLSGRKVRYDEASVAEYLKSIEVQVGSEKHGPTAGPSARALHHKD